MPLLDHFRPPLASQRHWESFHAGWAYEIAGWLNRILIPAGYLAEPVVTIGTQLQVDVASFDHQEGQSQANGPGGGTATALQTWAPPVTTLLMPAIFPDDIEVQVFETEGGSRLVGAIELVSPRCRWPCATAPRCGSNSKSPTRTRGKNWVCNAPPLASTRAAHRLTKAQSCSSHQRRIS
jgi:hypothetical protein